MTFGPTKGHERREVPLPRFLVDDLARHVAGCKSDDLVFTGQRGAVMRSGTFRRAALSEAAKALGIPGFHPHALRHTAASLAIASGADIKVVQQMLGHKSAVMTLDQYGHLFGDRLDVVADAMDAARADALRDVSTMCHEGEVVSLDDARNSG
jgi:integrase